LGLPPNLGDGGPATKAILQTYSLALAKDGSLLLSQGGSGRTFVRRVRPDGIIERFAGSGPYSDPEYWKPCTYKGDDGPALDAEVCNVVAVATAPDCSVYTLENGSLNGSWDGRLRKISPDGYIHTVLRIPGAPPTDHAGLKVGPDGSISFSRGLYRGDGDCRIERLTLGGNLETIAGTSCNSRITHLEPFYGPPGLATLNSVFELTVDKDGAVYASDEERILKVEPGINARSLLTSNPGKSSTNLISGLPLGQAVWDQSGAPALGPDGFLYVTNDSSWGKVFRVRPPTPRGVLDAAFVVPSADGSQAYVFDSEGRHTATKHALTGGTLYSFGYDPAGHLTSITDGNGNVTTINVDADGHPTQIVAPFGQVTNLATDDNGYISRVVDPSGGVTQFSYTTDGLMTEMIDAGNGMHSFEWDGGGSYGTPRGSLVSGPI
jgi:YD repeat-containing protein